jgi:TfoX/Sxy family transcriptional regulator of competence genes
MASTQDFVDFVLDQIEPRGRVTARRMFGEYGLYAGEKIVGLVCDDRLFIKPTDAGREFAGEIAEAPPYPGAKPYFLIEDRLEDRTWLSELVRVTEAALPAPQVRKKRKKKR